MLKLIGIPDFHKVFASHLFKTEAQKGIRKGAQETGLLSGGIESWKLKSLLMQMMFSIGEQGDLLPNTANWFAEKTNLSRQFFCANITEVVLSACASALEFSTMLKAGSTTKEHLVVLDYVEKVTHYHHIRLAVLKRILHGLAKSGSVIVPELSIMKTGNKEHYFWHLKEAIKKFGPDIRIFDTEASEKLHLKR